MNTYQNQNTFTVPEQYRGHNTLWRPQSLEDMNELTQDACGIGSVVNIDGHQDMCVLDDALHIVEKLEHRAGKDASGKVGDGVGILLQISHSFFKKAALMQGIQLRDERDYGVGMFFFPEDQLKRTFAKRMFEVITEKNGLRFLGWREVPVHPEILGQVAVDCMPHILQCFIERPEDAERGIDFDRRLYVLRREFEQSSEDTYICSLSSRTIVYKGMFLVKQLRAFYDDLRDPDYRTAIAIVHSRFSTNTTPSWDRAHPYRMIAHNGEINTIRGNIDRMLAREETMSSPLLEKDVEKIFPVVERSGSDSAMLDNTLEFLYMNGIDLPLAMMMTIPEPWKHNRFMDQNKKDFYHYYATMMEPWDGPAAILFSDGDVVGATLDRNGLRPSRYYITDDNRLILSSEVGVLDIDPKHIVQKSRLQPGRMLLVDTKAQRIIADEECKESYAAREPYGEWLDRNLLHIEDLKIPNRKIPTHTQEMRDRLYKVFGYSYEDVKSVILPMAQNGIEQTASMGHDVPLAVLSKQHQLLFNYFKQLFAQVTNPPIDSLREKIVTDTTVYIGSDGNLLQDQADNCRVLEVENPILTGVELMKIKDLDQPGFRTEVISLLYYKNTSLEKALEQLNISVDRAYQRGYNIIILSDRGVDENHVPIPSLLAVSSVEQHLVQTKKRTAVSLILESGEPRDVHQFATILGFGARAINPYLAHECIAEMIDIGILDKDYHTAIEDYNKAVLNGIVKIAAKMGISTIQSYQSAKIFEAIGLSKELVEKYFTGTVSRVGGIGIKDIAEGVTSRHDHAFDPMGLSLDTALDSVGFHQLRSGRGAEDHLYDPETIITLQRSVRSEEGDYKLFKEYTARIDDERRPHTLRGLMKFAAKNEPVPIEEVEPVSSIVKRFKTGAMSYGSISQEAHHALIENGLRNRVKLETDGKLMTGRDVVIAALLGAEEYGFATTALVCLGCMMMRVCNKDTCPFGVATQNDVLRKRFTGKPEYVMNFMRFIAQEMREYMAELGFRTVDEMIGRTDCLTVNASAAHVTSRSAEVDLSQVLDPRYASLPEEERHFDPKRVYDFHLEKTLDESVLLKKFAPAIVSGQHHEEKVEVSSTNRTFGTILGSEITDHYGMTPEGDTLPDDTFVVEAYGGGGQSFGAFIPKGLTIRLHGDANDGFGKGLSGGKLVVAPPEGSPFRASENIIVGNVALYGATAGKCYVNGVAGERFCVRNSGATAVAEGCGDHGLEYMTGGRAVILGPTGKNFAAGMSGGIAYVLDMDHSLYLKLNKDMVSLLEVTEKYDIKELKDILTDYVKETKSELGTEILQNFDMFLPSFKKIVPNDYQKVLIAVSHFEEQGISHENAELEAFKSLFN